MERGDTLWRIAHAHQTSVQDILKANPQLRPSQIKPGQRVLLPGVEHLRKVEKRVSRVIEQRSKAPSSSAKLNSTPARKRNASSSKPATQQAKHFQLEWPAKGEMISSFGKRNQKMHNGIDIKLKPSSDIRSASEGEVIFVGDEIQGYGQTIILSHAQNLFTVYAHLGTPIVRLKDKIGAGQVIAKSGLSSDQSYLHFEIRQAKIAYDPLKFLPSK
ncbi:MAG: M23 family metallopeptidase [Bdellovibrionota bacterium]